MGIRDFIDGHFRHFNAAALRDAARAYEELLAGGGKMFLAMAGAMSTAEIGLSLAEMIRQGKVHAICCTGANLEEDVYNLIARDDYRRVPDYRHLTPGEEQSIYDDGLSRITDTCIPEDAMVRLENVILPRWRKACEAGERLLPHEFLCGALLDGELEDQYRIDPSASWLLAAAEAGLPIFVPGWEDSTLGNGYAACLINGKLPEPCVKSGVDYMTELVRWYRDNEDTPTGFFQIGGGIAGDFPICVVPLIAKDLPPGAGETYDVRCWEYFCQVSDSTTSYGSYSGASPNEKITWGKLTPDTPRFVIESDATIVVPLVFAYLLGW